MSTPSSRARPWNILALTLHLLAPSPALAQGVDPQRALTAQALYEQATAEMDAKSDRSACRKLEEVTRIVPEGIGARLTLGRCCEARGSLASAWSQFALVQVSITPGGAVVIKSVVHISDHPHSSPAPSSSEAGCVTIALPRWAAPSLHG